MDCVVMSCVCRKWIWYMSMYIYGYLCNIYINICIYICIYVYIYAYMYMCVYIYMKECLITRIVEYLRLACSAIATSTTSSWPLMLTHLPWQGYPNSWMVYIGQSIYRMPDNWVYPYGLESPIWMYMIWWVAILPCSQSSEITIENCCVFSIV